MAPPANAPSFFVAPAKEEALLGGKAQEASSGRKTGGKEAVLQVLRDMGAELLPLSRKEGYEPPPVLRRFRLQLQRNGPRLHAAVTQCVWDCRDWVAAGGTLRILLALTVLSVAGAAAAGATLFGAILAVATANAMLVAFVLCLAAACSFLAMFLAALSAVYVGVLVSSATVIGFITIVAMSSAFGISLIVGGFYLAYQAASIALQFVSTTKPIVVSSTLVKPS
ncbi:hypothetical protein KFL_006670020 [Klebsormidium nitens]|uniref:Uncharacterized protein n=1 Tax=Klebsormidium nitens TaxID=105231 RepID=A0A0U9HMG5_KLENI|nr:hypothetical protein KFL_006670020 [Klebsormidium nitens]|eukprot:GAQ90644.1 hypothetical protein KFL_006670020 [Klebsormidium nitens]